MKISVKILLAVAVFTFIGLIIHMLVMRKDLKTLIKESNEEISYKTVAAGNFTGLDFSPGWSVKIKQGRECKVELATEENREMKPILKNVNGILIFNADTLNLAGKIHARITVPKVKTIKTSGDTKIQMDYFQSDTLFVELKNGSTFTGNNNKFIYVSFKTSGENRMEFTTTMP